MIMLPSAASTFYRKFGRQYVQIKRYSSCLAAYRALQGDNIFTVDNSSKLYRYFRSSVYFNEKSEIKDAKDVKLNANDIKETEKVKQKLGNIIVKTETDADNVVTKVTIEKPKQEHEQKSEKQAVAAPTSKSFCLTLAIVISNHFSMGTFTLHLSQLLPNHSYGFQASYTHIIFLHS